MKRLLCGLSLFAFGCLALPAAEPPSSAQDPAGVLRKPIPEKLVVLTFDDGPLSSYTVVDPILKSYGFGGSFYVCDFDSFKTRKDWYMTWRQMKALAADGFEVGNHSRGHSPGFDAMMDMEDELLANNVVKPVTIAWPLHMANVQDVPKFIENGYTFARDGHFRPYRPTVDHPFNIPCLGASTMEEFVKSVRQATGGKIVVLCYHGVPDMEHPPVSLEPEVFKMQMQYLKDNNYKAIALRDLAEYIDPAKAAKLPPTANEYKEPGPVALAEELKPYVPVEREILHFGFPNLPGGNISKTTITLTVPHTADLTSVAPQVRLPAGATLMPGPDVAQDFTKPQTYTLTCKDGFTRTYTVTVNRAEICKDSFLQQCSVPGCAVAMAGTEICIYAPAAADVLKLAPVFTLGAFARAVPPSGTERDFSSPQTYTVTAQDGSSQVYHVKAVRIGQPNAFAWNRSEPGVWSDGAKWSNNVSAASAPLPAAGHPDGILVFNKSGANVISNDLNAGFQLNQLDLPEGAAGMTLAGSGIKFVKSAASGIPAAIHATRCQRINLNVPVELGSDLHVTTLLDKDPNTYILFNSMISGPGALILNSAGDPDVPKSNFHDVHFGILQINGANTYSGGTFVNGGKIEVQKVTGLGTGPVTLNNYGRLTSDSRMTNSLTINSGTLCHCTWGGPVALNGIASFIGNCNLYGDMSGPGGFVMLGTQGTYLNVVPGGTVTLHGTNTYAGPTTVFPGALVVKKAAGLYNANPARWTPANITIYKAAMLQLSAGGPGEFTGPQLSALLAKLTAGIRNNGLMEGSAFCLDTANATGPVVLDGNITDSQGAGGGPFTFKLCGGGTVQLSGKNTYTGQTVVEDGTLIVSSLNSVAHGKASSSLGAPSSLETGIVELGGDCTLTYTGSGEVTDRILNLTGKKQTVTLNQAGGGLLKFTSSLDLSGYGHSKQLVLTGTGAGELAGSIRNPDARRKEAALALTKSGAGVWTLSGTNTYSGPTEVTGGTLALASAVSLGGQTEVRLSKGAMLDLPFRGKMKIRALYLDGKQQPAGAYNTRALPAFIKGSGTLRVPGA